MVDEKQEQKEKTHNLTYTETEVMQEIQSLENDEEVELFLKVQRGALKYNKYLQFKDIEGKIKEVPKE